MQQLKHGIGNVIELYCHFWKIHATDSDNIFLDFSDQMIGKYSSKK